MQNEIIGVIAFALLCIFAFISILKEEKNEYVVFDVATEDEVLDKIRNHNIVTHTKQDQPQEEEKPISEMSELKRQFEIWRENNRALFASERSAAS